LKKKTKTRSRKSKELKVVSSLNEKVCGLIKKLTNKDVQQKVETRRYGSNEFEIPNPILQFIDSDLKDKTFDNEKLGLTGIDFCGEFILNKEECVFKFMHDNEDYMLIADGDQLLAVRQLDTKQDLGDFNVYALFDDNVDTFKGPWKLSELLADLEEIEIVEEENDE